MTHTRDLSGLTWRPAGAETLSGWGPSEADGVYRGPRVPQTSLRNRVVQDVSHTSSRGGPILWGLLSVPVRSPPCVTGSRKSISGSRVCVGPSVNHPWTSLRPVVEDPPTGVGRRRVGTRGDSDGPHRGSRRGTYVGTRHRKHPSTRMTESFRRGWSTFQDPGSRVPTRRHG